MATIIVSKERLLKSIGKENWSDEQFSQLCFDYGLELDDISIDEITRESNYHIDIPANRFDLFCIEGLIRALNFYLKNDYNFGKSVNEAGSNFYKAKDIRVSKDVVVIKYKTPIRRHIAVCIIRNLKPFDIQSLMDYQDKLHSTLGCNRSLVAIGTHDLDEMFKLANNIDELSENITTCPINISYSYSSECRNFTPLNTFTGTTEKSSVSTIDELKKNFIADKKIYNYFSLLPQPNGEKSKNSNEGLSSVMFTLNSSQINSPKIISIPPIINSNISRVSLNTKNLFIEITGNNQNKVNQAMVSLVNNFRGEFIENVRIVEVDEDVATDGYVEVMDWEDKGKLIDYFSIFYDNRKLSLNCINKQLKLNLSIDEVTVLLKKMMYWISDVKSVAEDFIITLSSDVSRLDVINDPDVIEDIAIGYGYNNFKMTLPEISTIGNENLLNKISNKLRNEMALGGYNEILSLSLLSKEEGFKDSVYLKNYKSLDCAVIRPTLIQGLFRALFYNQHYKLPIKMFEISDIVVLSKNRTGEYTERDCLNRRHLAGLLAHNSSCFDEIQGLLLHILMKCDISDVIFRPLSFNQEFSNCNYTKEYLEDISKLFILPQTAEVLIKTPSSSSSGVGIDSSNMDKFLSIGVVGVVNPISVNKFYKVNYPISAFEIDVETIFENFFL